MIQPNPFPVAGNIASAGACCQHCADQSGGVAYTWSVASHDCWCKTSTQGREQKNGFISGTCGSGAGGRRVVYDNGKNVQQAVAVAKAADLAIVVVGATSSEGADRSTLLLQDDALAAAVSSAQTRTIVVAVTPGPFLAGNWSEAAAAILAVGLPGQEEGNAVAEVLFHGPRAQALGAPRGRLPYTVPNSENEMGFTPLMYPGIDHQANYTERLVGGEGEGGRRGRERESGKLVRWRGTDGRGGEG